MTEALIGSSHGLFQSSRRHVLSTGVYAIACRATRKHRTRESMNHRSFFQKEFRWRHLPSSAFLFLFLLSGRVDCGHKRGQFPEFDGSAVSGTRSRYATASTSSLSLNPAEVGRQAAADLPHTEDVDLRLDLHVATSSRITGSESIGPPSQRR